MLNILNYIEIIIFYSFYMFIAFACTNYIIKSLFFVQPMCKHYKIMAPDLSNDIRGRYPYILIALLPISIFIISTYIIGPYFFILILVIYIYYIYTLIKRYKNSDLLDYINEFSADLFDWEKIYDLHIDEHIKRKCFRVHNIDYENFERHYLEKLKYKQSELEKNIENKK